METLTARLLGEIVKTPFVDTRSRIDPAHPAARDLDDLLGDPSIAELARSTGLDVRLLGSEVPAEDRARAIADALPHFDNTVQAGWFLEMARQLFGFAHEHIDGSGVDELWRLAERNLSDGGWAEDLCRRAGLERALVVSRFDAPLEDFRLPTYVPCLCVDEVVSDLGNPSVVERLRQAGRVDVGNADGVRAALTAIFEDFREHGARACVASLPSVKAAEPVSDNDADTAIRHLLAGEAAGPHERFMASQFVLWTVAKLCRTHDFPFHVMVTEALDPRDRSSYTEERWNTGAFRSNTSLHAYHALFAAFPGVTFPVSVPGMALHQELLTLSRHFPNVWTSGHGSGSDLPGQIEAETRSRLDAVPRTKQIGYWSGASKLEFLIPKYNMYRRALANVLATDFVGSRGWSEERAVALARNLLYDNPVKAFGLEVSC